MRQVTNTISDQLRGRRVLVWVRHGLAQVVDDLTYLPRPKMQVGWEFERCVGTCEVLEDLREYDGGAAGVGRSGRAQPSIPIKVQAV